MHNTKFLECRVRRACNHCGNIMELGERIWPISEAMGRPLYGHFSCAQELEAQGKIKLEPPLCKHFMRRGFCLAGNACFFRHPDECAMSKPENSIMSAALAGVTLKKSNAEAMKYNRGVGKRNKVRNDWRASMFRMWLIDTYGPELLVSGSGVLDVAGGMGELSFELTNINSIPSTVVDPRPLDLRMSLRKLQNGLFQRSMLFGPYNVPWQLLLQKEDSAKPLNSNWGLVVSDDQQHTWKSNWCEPGHLRMRLTNQVVEALVEMRREHNGGNACTMNDELCSVSGHNSSEVKGTVSPPLIEDAKQFHEAEQSYIPIDSKAEALVSALRLVSKEMEWAKNLEWTKKGLQCGEHEEDQGDAEDLAASCEQVAAKRALRCQDVINEQLTALSTPQPILKELSEYDAQSRRSPALREESKESAVMSLSWNDQHPVSVPEIAAAGNHPVEVPEGNHKSGETRMDALSLGAESDNPSYVEYAAIPNKDALKALNVIQACSIVVGMHPDQASTPLVDLAILLNKPFALVPCCVYSSHFPKRRLADGRHVRSYEELIKCIIEKDPEHVRVAELPFEGKNLVVYRLPSK
ncbi:hypothetical protein CEUSTIGMA_g11263.t1 [Chlamydomonas eustigma]|uniref:C3H1-type domain-containing protein n=1 Tax=Chlamydomonas eustigma TaxID=1157962 RepID=A0A250XLN0_9CHLO|nr:hypothetical protein CEUSTIGMA_g11263.t1 [Chlamydomonas eustigma]|eukprot:GAX83839.1 hypothetical protein CEUSTIGMA_g11263.t1 [Chlamydomonas eustigma]